jgi:hypothetical protein
LAYRPPDSSTLSQNKPAISYQSVVLFSQNKPAPGISHQPNELAGRLEIFPRTRKALSTLAESAFNRPAETTRGFYLYAIKKHGADLCATKKIARACVPSA